jgi:hypothetical protein
LDEVAKKLPALWERINDVVTRLDKAEPQLVRLNKQVGDLEDKFAGKPLAPAMSDRLNRKLAPFRKFLEGLGLRGTRDEVPFYSGTADSDTAMFYMPTDSKIIIGASFRSSEMFLDAPDAAAREFAHHVLFVSLGGQRNPELFFRSEALVGLESGLADYYVASWTDNPSLFRAAAAVLKEKIGFDRDEIRNLKNDRLLKDLPKAGPSQTAGEVWGGLFWELRGQLGQSIADKLLADAWKSIRPEEEKRGPLALARSLRDSLVELANPLAGGKHVASIRKVFERRGLAP